MEPKQEFSLMYEGCRAVGRFTCRIYKVSPGSLARGVPGSNMMFRAAPDGRRLLSSGSHAAQQSSVRSIKMKKSLKLLIAAFGELPDESWKEEVTAAKSRLRERIASYKGGIRLETEVAATNIGRGADWIVLALSFGLAAAAIPALHKKVRENIEEWRRIYRELHTFFSWVLEGRSALYPDEYLFLKAIENLSEQSLPDSMEFKGMFRIPDLNPDLQGREALIFSFSDTSQFVQVAISRSGEVLWRNSVQLECTEKTL